MGEDRCACVGSPEQSADEAATDRDLAGCSICLARSGAPAYALEDEGNHGQVRLCEGEVEAGFAKCSMEVQLPSHSNEVGTRA